MIYICSSLESTGPTNQLLNIIRGNHSRIEFNVITLSPEPAFSLSENFKLPNVKLIPAYDKGSSFLSLIRRVKEISSEIDYDLIHSQGIRGDVISAILFRNNVSTLRNYPYEDYPPLYGKIKGNLMATAHLCSMFFIKRAVTVSSSNADRLKKTFNLNFYVINNAVDTERFNRVIGDFENDIICKLRLDDRKVLIYTGPLIERKNVESLVRYIYGSNDYQLIVVGDGPLKKSLVENYSSKNIHFVGSVKNVESYLSIADYFVMLSSSEGFPNSVLEALATGLPCILSDIPAHRDVKNIVGSSIALYDNKDFLVFLAKSIEEFEENHESCELRNFVVGNLSVDSMSERYYQCYIDMLQG